MANRFIPAATLALACAGAALAQTEKLDPKNGDSWVKASFDYGHIVHGFNEDTKQDYEWQVFRRSNIGVFRQLKLTDHVEVKMGFGGVFFYVLPEQDGAPHTRLPKFGLGPGNAELAYHFGDPAHPWSDLQLGIFPYKYNPDASNLGEYLLRSVVYPQILVTGGFDMINSARYQVQGAAYHLNLLDNRWTTSFLLPMESSFAPMHSISPTVVTSFKMIPGLDIGAGVTFSHLISGKQSKESPKFKDVPSTNPKYMIYPTSIVTDLQKKKIADPDTTHPAGSTIDSLISITRDTTQFYTYQGTKLMGRLSYDFKVPFGLEESMSPPDLRVFAEVAVLGTKDYPFYYPDIKYRIPLMFGMNLPTFKLLDMLSVQGEYYNNLWTNNIDGVFELNRPVPYHKDYDPINGPEYTAKQAKDDRWHWSVLAKKTLLKGANAYLQVANDHTRTFDYNIKPVKIPITNRPADWYYLCRLEVGI